jgi:hypothetical protein
MEQATRLPDSVQKVIRLHSIQDSNEGVQSTPPRPTVVYSIEESGTRKKSSKPVRGLDKAVRKMLAAQEVAVDVYRDLHERSSRREKNGWLYDLRKNLRKAGRRAKKKL